jgi:hypothetical protein
MRDGQSFHEKANFKGRQRGVLENTVLAFARKLVVVLPSWSIHCSAGADVSFSRWLASRRPAAILSIFLFVCSWLAYSCIALHRVFSLLHLSWIVYYHALLSALSLACYIWRPILGLHQRGSPICMAGRRWREVIFGCASQEIERHWYIVSWLGFIQRYVL